MGSKVGTEKYYERKITYEVFKKDNISIKFFKKIRLVKNHLKGKKTNDSIYKNIKYLTDLDISARISI